MAIRPSLEVTYKTWPFGCRFDDGFNNIGAIDLTQEPHRIDEIYEISNAIKAKPAIKAINENNTAIMTLGVEFGPYKDYYSGYIEFCFRLNIDKSSIELDTLDERLIDYVATNKGIEAANYIQDVFRWEYHEATIHGSAPQKIYTVWFYERSHDEADHLLAFLVDWLHHEFLHLA